MKQSYTLLGLNWRITVLLVHFTVWKCVVWVLHLDSIAICWLQLLVIVLLLHSWSRGNKHARWLSGWTYTPTFSGSEGLLNLDEEELFFFMELIFKGTNTYEMFKKKIKICLLHECFQKHSSDAPRTLIRAEHWTKIESLSASTIL